MLNRFSCIQARISTSCTTLVFFVRCHSGIVSFQSCLLMHRLQQQQHLMMDTFPFPCRLCSLVCSLAIAFNVIKFFIATSGDFRKVLLVTRRICSQSLQSACGHPCKCMHTLTHTTLRTYNIYIYGKGSLSMCVLNLIPRGNCFRTAKLEQGHLTIN